VIEFKNDFPHVHVCIDAELADIDTKSMLLRWNSFAKRLNSGTFGHIHSEPGSLSSQSRHRLCNYLVKSFQNPAALMPKYLLSYPAGSLHFYAASRMMPPSTKPRKARTIKQSSRIRTKRPRPSVGQSLAACGEKTAISRVETVNGHKLRFTEQVLNVRMSEINRLFGSDVRTDVIPIDAQQKEYLIASTPSCYGDLPRFQEGGNYTPIQAKINNFLRAVEFIRIAATKEYCDFGIALVLEKAERNLGLLVEEAIENRH
jgi:hypothetical protein